MQKLRVLDLFSGIGGFSLGLERTGGFETVAFCEKSPFCADILQKHWPKVPVYDDVRTLSAIDLRHDGVGAIDVICGGFPCQDLSRAGSRAGLEGSRSGLWREFARIICEVRPSFVIVENVPDLLGLGLGEVLGDLASLGFNAVWDCIPAAVLGAPHGRDRIFVTAYAPEESWLHEPNVGNQLWRWVSDDRNAWQASPWTSPAAAVCRVDDGIPDRVDRTGACGNSVVPKIIELHGNAILEARAA